MLALLFIGGSSLSAYFKKNEAKLSIVDGQNYLNNIDRMPTEEEILNEAEANAEDAVINLGETETQKFGRRLFSGYLTLKENGSISQEGIDAVAEATVENIEAQKKIPYFSTKDIVTFEDSNTDLIIAYATNVALIKKRYTDEYLKNPIEYINADNIESEELQNKFKNISGLYLNFAKELKNLSAPRGAVVNHLNLINVYVDSANNTNDMSFIGTDPLKAMLAFQAQSEIGSRESEILSNFLTYFNANGIIFANTEARLFWQGT
ncbi:MAG: hypothetical protein AB200_02350 [Parcubacteria bacterium C7867-005]|nr:MAG: hypothetical protein AB200_02350 [Parcubacteria bacterium C7867-005]